MQQNYILGDLSELSIQTSNFEQKFSKNLTSNGFSPETLTSSSRSSSYSSIVSNSSAENQKAKTDKRFTSPFQTFTDSPGKAMFFCCFFVLLKLKIVEGLNFD